MEITLKLTSKGHLENKYPTKYMRDIGEDDGQRITANYHFLWVSFTFVATSHALNLQIASLTQSTLCQKLPLQIIYMLSCSIVLHILGT